MKLSAYPWPGPGEAEEHHPNCATTVLMDDKVVIVATDESVPPRMYEAVDGPDATVVHAGAVEQSPSGRWVVRHRRTLCSRSVKKPRRARRRIGRARDLTNVDCRQCLRQLAKLQMATN
ncbi:hypothetical protein A4G29_20355 [Mycobacterium kansasii]|nr:hypothetical protein A4G29_20355 [Mycobacterium kansasii]